MEEPENFLREEVGKRFTLKEKSIGPPTQYLVNKLSDVTMKDGTKFWIFSSSQYVQSAAANVEDYLHKRGQKLPKTKLPWPSTYRSEVDVSPELGAYEAAYFQSLVGVLRWIFELGRSDLAMENSDMASIMALPRKGHLKVLFQMFAFLNNKHNAFMVFDPTEPDINESKFNNEDW